MRRLPQEKIEQIIELRKQGMTYQQISRHGFSYGAVAKYCKKHIPDIKFKHKNYLSEDDISLIKKLRSQRMSMLEIKRRTGLGYVSIFEISNKYIPGVKFAREDMVKPKELESMIDYRRKGYTYTKIGKLLNRDASTVSRNLKKTISS